MERDQRHQFDALQSGLLTGLGLLTRLPLPDYQARGPEAGWSWPLVGLILGVIAALAGYIALSFGLPASLAALIVVGVQIICTGALHEDGLADTADGLWGGWTRERRLEIMRDSRIGSYGVIATVLALMARGVALTLLMAEGYCAALIVAGVLSRGILPGVMALVPNARQDGLSRGVGRPSHRIAGVAAALAVVLALIFAGGTAISAVIAVLVITCITALIARARIGGQTGDILGAIQVLAVLAVLFVIV